MARPPLLDRLQRCGSPALGVLALGLTAWLSDLLSRLYRRNVVDDAAISLVYARNLAQGNGLVFNVGERVEGYTNFLWTLLIAPLYTLSGGNDEAFVLWVVRLCWLCNLGIVALLYVAGRRFWGRPWLPMLFGLGVLVADQAFLAWGAFGLENPLLGFWFLLAVVLALKPGNSIQRGAWLGLALLLAHLTRPDAGLFGAALLCASASRWLFGERSREVVVFTGAALASWVVPYAGYFAWRWSYYGYPLPNTYYLKLGGEVDGWARGLAYSGSFFDDRAWIPLVCLALGFFAWRSWVLRGLLLYLILHVAYVTYAGGDFFSGHRFYASQLPLFAFVGAAGLHAAGAWLQRDAVRARLLELGAPPAAFAGAALALTLVGLKVEWQRGKERGPFKHEVKVWREQLHATRQLMSWLRENKPDDANVATGLIGHTALFAHTPIVDVYGVTDPEVAHQPVVIGQGLAGHEKTATLEYVLSRKPTYIAYGYYKHDFWVRGYFFNIDTPVSSAAPGIWQRDTLRKRAEPLLDTLIDFRPGQTHSWAFEGSAFSGEAFPRAEVPSNRRAPVGIVAPYLSTFHSSFGRRGDRRRAVGSLPGDG